MAERKGCKEKMLNQILKKDFDLLTLQDKKFLTNAVAEQIFLEFEHQDRGGLYGYLQRNMAYNSNRIEGSRLTEDETALLFDTGEILSNGEVVYRAKDIEEMNGHFLLFNHMLKTLDEPLSEELIKQYHFQLEAGVFEFRANGYVPGEYKSRQNTVGGITTSHPKNVPADMSGLISEYNKKECIDLFHLADFHAVYETIHPFQDGNGRTGRMILLRESLKNGICPFIIQDENKARYYTALKDYQKEQSAGKLAEYFQQEQVALYDKLQHYLYNHSLDKDVFLEDLEP